MPGSKIPDSWALLAWLLDQPAAARVGALLEEAGKGDGVPRLLMPMATRKIGLSKAEEFLRRLPSLPLRLVVPQAGDFIEAARLKATRRISNADAFAAALAQREDAALVTGDPELKELGDILTVEWIGS